MDLWNSTSWTRKKHDCEAKDYDEEWTHTSGSLERMVRGYDSPHARCKWFSRRRSTLNKVEVPYIYVSATAPFRGIVGPW
jgi:hypothetical protein